MKMEDDRRLFHNAALRKHRKEVTERMDVLKSTGGSRVRNAVAVIVNIPSSNQWWCMDLNNYFHCFNQGNGELVLDAENPTSPRGVQYPFVVGERVLIMVQGAQLLLALALLRNNKGQK